MFFEAVFCRLARMHMRPFIVHKAPVLVVCCGLLSISSFACNKAAPEPEPSAPQVTSEDRNTVKPAETQQAPNQPAAHPVPKGDLGIEWTAPSHWKLGPARPMRKATYEIPQAEGDSEGAELAVFYFGEGQGGDVDANIKRWVAQFGDIKDDDVKRSERSANELKQTIVEIQKGTYTNSMAMHGPKGPQKDFSLLGAVVEAPSGKYFFKMTGPEKTVAAAKDDFFKLLDTAKAKK